MHMSQVTGENIGDVDVLITTPHTKLPVDVDAVTFHRLIVDESHLLDTSNKAGGTSSWGARQLAFLKSIQAPHVWCVSGTPFVLEGGRLTFTNQLDLLGHARDGLALGSKPLTDRIVDSVKRLMIRHSKSQRKQRLSARVSAACVPLRLSSLFLAPPLLPHWPPRSSPSGQVSMAMWPSRCPPPPSRPC